MYQAKNFMKFKNIFDKFKGNLGLELFFFNKRRNL